MKNFRNFQATILTIITLLVICVPAKAASLWNSESKSLYTKQVRQFKVGDLITIIIVEQAAASQNAESSNGKNGEIKAGPGTGVLDSIPGLGMDWDSSYKGKGTTTRGGSLTAKLTVSVIDILPEGILMVEGRQVIKVNKEDQLLTIRGKIRPDDVNGENFVYSTYVADAVIEYQGKGTLGETQSPGILTRFFHWLF